MVELNDIEYEGRHLLAVESVLSSIDYTPPVPGPVPKAYSPNDFWYVKMYGEIWKTTKDAVVTRILSLAQKSIDVIVEADPGDSPVKPTEPDWKKVKDKDREKIQKKWKEDKKAYDDNYKVWNEAKQKHNKSKKQKETHLDKAKEFKAAYDLIVEQEG